jgi:GT2 family glycosyltransferase
LIYIITVNYKQEKYLNQIIDIVKKRHDTYLIIVDNSKSINNMPKSNKIEYIIPDKNIGYLSGLCLGVEKIKVAPNDIFILCNPDIIFNDNFFNKLNNLTHFNDNDLIAPSIINYSQNNQNPNRINIFSKTEVLLYDIEFFSFLSFIMTRLIKKIIKKLFLYFRVSNKPVLFEKNYEIFLPHGSCMILKGAFFNKKPYFDYNVFLWGEEAIIADKVRRKGGKVIFQPDLEVHHISHSAIKYINNYKKYKIWKESYKIYRELLF